MAPVLGTAAMLCVEDVKLCRAALPLQQRQHQSDVLLYQYSTCAMWQHVILSEDWINKQGGQILAMIHLHSTLFGDLASSQLLQDSLLSVSWLCALSFSISINKEAFH